MFAVGMCLLLSLLLLSLMVTISSDYYVCITLIVLLFNFRSTFILHLHHQSVNVSHKYLVHVQLNFLISECPCRLGEIKQREETGYPKLLCEGIVLQENELVADLSVMIMFNH